MTEAAISATLNFLCAMSHDPDQSNGSRMADIAERMGVTPDNANSTESA